MKLAECTSQCWIEVVHVVPQAPPSAYEFFFAGDSTEESYQKGYDILKQAEDLLDVSSHPFRTVILEGHAAKAITDYAKANQVDLIVMGSKGLSTFDELFLGSVSHQVTQMCSMSVIIVK